MSLFFISLFSRKFYINQSISSTHPNTECFLFCILLVCDGFFKSSIVKITRCTKTAFKCSCIKQLHVQIKQCQFLLFDCYKSYLILHFTVPGFKSIVVSCFMKNTLLIYVPIYSCFLSLNLTLIMAFYNLTHISLILPSTTCFLFCILLECW